MDIYQVLRQEHDQVQEMLDQQVEGKKTGMLKEIQQQLNAHMSIEEKLFYPLLTKEEVSKEDAFEAYEEHHVAKVTLNELMRMDADDERFMAKMKVLKELIDHHVQEEERNLFKVSKKVLDGNKAKELGQKFLQEKEKMLGKPK